jgi:hypothetical protein
MNGRNVLSSPQSFPPIAAARSIANRTQVSREVPIFLSPRDSKRLMLAGDPATTSNIADLSSDFFSCWLRSPASLIFQKLARPSGCFTDVLKITVPMTDHKACNFIV